MSSETDYKLAERFVVALETIARKMPEPQSVSGVGCRCISIGLPSGTHVNGCPESGLGLPPEGTWRSPPSRATPSYPPQTCKDCGEHNGDHLSICSYWDKKS